MAFFPPPYTLRARHLDCEVSLLADGTGYPEPQEQVRDHLEYLVGPVLAALRTWEPVVGLVVGSYQGSSAAVHTLARESAEKSAKDKWRVMGQRDEAEALGIFMHDVRRRWGSVFWRS